MKKDIQLKNFRSDLFSLINNHPIVLANEYTAWFSKGDATLDELRYFTVQFSVFSHLFIEAQLRKCISAYDLETYRAGKEILLNELGVSFSNYGSVEGQRFKFEAGHFEWLANFARHLDLNFKQIGKRSYGNDSTLLCCDALLLYYGSANPSIAAGASYAIEHWAAAGFWKQLIKGLKQIKSNQLADLPLGFWLWHDALEEQHATHTNDELTEIFFKENFSESNFLRGARATLDAIAIFWDGLETERKKNQAA